MRALSLMRNTTYITVASIGQKIISFFYFTLIARSLGPMSTGRYFFALAFTTIAVVFVDLGFTNVLIREVAKDRTRLQTYLSSVIWIKILLGALAYVGVVLVINKLGYPIETKQLVYISGITMLFDSLHLTLYGVLRALGDLRYESASIVLSQLLSLILGSTFLYFHLPLIFLMLAFTIPSLINAASVSLILYRQHGLILHPRYDAKSLRHLGVIALPFALAAIFARVYGYIDSVLLSKLAGDAAVGWYSIPYKITFAFQFIPLSLNAALYPRLSECYAVNREKLARIFEQGMTYLLILSVPIAIGISVLAKPIVLAIYTTSYLPSVRPLQILVISLIFSFLSFPIGALLNASNRQVAQMSIVGSVMVLNIILNLLFIPRYSVMGAAATACAGNVFLAAIGYCFVYRLIPTTHRYLLSIAVRILVSGLAMGVAVWYLGSISILLAIGAGVAIYLIMLWLTKTVCTNQLREAVAFLRRH